MAYRLGGRVVRVLRPAAYVWGSEAGYAREPALLALLAARGLPVPRNVEAVHDPDDPGGRIEAVVHDYLPGRPLSAVSLRGAARSRLIDDLAAFLTALHGTPRRQARATGVPDIDLGEQLYRPLIEACLPLLGPRSRAWVSGRFERFLADGGSRGAPRVLVHGDLHREHLLLNRDQRLAGVIDWGDAYIADPAFDFAALRRQFSVAFVGEIIARYEGPDAGEYDFQRRIRFYLDVEQLYGVQYGDLVDDGRERPRALRRIATKAAAAARRT